MLAVAVAPDAAWSDLPSAGLFAPLVLRGLATLSASGQAGETAVAGRGRAFLRPSGTEPVVRVTVEADDDVLVQNTLEKLADAVRAAA